MVCAGAWWTVDERVRPVSVSALPVIPVVRTVAPPSPSNAIGLTVALDWMMEVFGTIDSEHPVSTRPIIGQVDAVCGRREF
jgi:hypothetical protein